MIPSQISFLGPVFLTLYVTSLLMLIVYGCHRYWIVFQYWKYHKRGVKIRLEPLGVNEHPFVTIQLPLYNEQFVVERLINTVASMDYPADRFEIQVLDDSVDQTVEIAQKRIEHFKNLGINIHYIRRAVRRGYKAGALTHGLKSARGEYVAIFDADFVPPANFLKDTLPYFRDPKIGMVQTRWGHLNANYSLMTRLQSMFLDGHFVLEHLARYKSGSFFNFNGTAGIWRRAAIDSAGGWSSRTLTEDLDLSYRAQLKGWKFIYQPDLVCPAELPADIHSFRSQQHRWAKGAVQVMRHMLKEIWRSEISLKSKFESTFHLSTNIGYFMTAVAVTLHLPTILLRHYWSRWPQLGWLEVASFVFTSLSVVVLYGVSQRELYSDWKKKITDIPALMAFGIGMSLNNVVAVWGGLFSDDLEFVRTPKFNITKRPAKKKKRGIAFGKPAAWVAPSFFALYSTVTLIVAAHLKEWPTVPFIVLFMIGFIYVAGLGLARPRDLT